MSNIDKEKQANDFKAQQREQFLKNATPKSKGIGGHIGDAATSFFIKGGISIPELAVGLADIPTGGRVGKFLENEGGMLGFRPKEAKEFASKNLMTEKSQKQVEAFQEAEGFTGKVGNALKNPSLIANTVTESLPAMFSGGIISRGLGIAAKGLSPVAAGALGEGIVGAGLQAESIRQQTEDGLLTPKQAGLAAATGATTAGFGYAGGRLAKELGIGDFETIMAGGGRTANPAADIAGSAAANAAKNKGIIRRGAEGALTEGLLEELPQSVSETILQNQALGRPLDEGVSDAAALGLLSGAAMGAGAGMFAKNRAPQDRITPTEDMGQEDSGYGPTNPLDPNFNPAGLLGNQAAPQLGFQGRASNQFNTGPNGEVFTGDQYNEYLAGQQERAQQARDSGGLQDIRDITPTPQGYDQAGNDPRLPAPDGTDFTAGTDGQVYGRDDINTRLSQERDAAAERRARIARGEILDRTPIPEAPKPSELMGLDPNKGSLSAAAALAVDSGASDVGNQLRDAVAQEPQMNVWQSGMMDRLSNADQNNSAYARLAQAMQNEPASVSEKARLMREADALPRAEVAAKQIKPNTRVLDEVRAQTKAYTPEGKEVQAQWDVVDASDLVTSNTDSFTINPDFPASRQPRDRTRASAQQQVNEIASKLQPNLLGESPDVSTGAPFVGANDNVVDSGNGRSMAIRRVYQEGGEKAGEYRQFVNEQAAKFGLDTDAVNMMQSPVLVRRNTSDMNRDEFARAANKPTAARMSSTEQAASDAKSLPDASLLSFNSEGSMSLHQSQRYLKNFIAALPKTEQGSLMDESGALSREGKSRIEAAIVQDAYNNPRLVSAISEKLDNDTTNVLRAVTDKAPQISQINADIKTGDVYDNTLARDIADATQAYIDLKNTDKNINDYLSQDSLLGDGLTDGAKEILGVLSDNRRSAKAIGEYIQERINAVTGRGNPKQGGLSFDDDMETDAPNILNNEPATQLTDENPTVNIPSPKQTRPKVESTEPPVRDVPIGEWVDGMNNAIDRNLAKQKTDSAADAPKTATAPEVSNEKDPTSYRLPTKEESYWNLSAPSTERESVLVDAVSQALDEGVIYNKDLNKRVAEILNIPQSVLDVNTRNTENGDFGYDVFNARKKVEANNRDNSNNEARERLKSRLSVGRNIGTIVTDSGKTLRRATIESMDDKSVKIAGTTGSKRLMYGVNYSTLEDAIKRAEDEGKREKFTATKTTVKLQPQAPVAKSETVAASPAKPPQSSVAKTETAPALRQLDATGRAKDGKSIKAGEQFQTATNRETTPYPKQKSERYASQWLIDNAVAEAEARGNKFAARQFANTDIQKGGYLLQADQEGMQQYLFDESSTDADVKVTSLKDMAEANEQKTIAPKPSEPKFSRAAGLSETVELKDLLVVHNITSEGVLAATDLGGLAAPSIAVIRSEVSDFTGYGEITLIADPLFITGKDMPTYDADIYSPRQPRAQNDINRKRFDAYEESLAGTKYGLRFTDLRSLEMSDGEYQFMRSPAVQYQFLESIGKIPKLKNKAIDPLVKKAAKLKASRYDLFDDAKFRSVYNDYAKEKISKALEIDANRKGFETAASQEDVDFFNSIYFNEDGSANRDALRKFYDSVISYRESDGKDFNQLKSDISEKMRSPLMQRRYEKWAGEQFNNLSDGKRLPNGETRSGARKYKPYNLENVVKEMTRELNNGESFNYGAGNVRSVYAGELRTLNDIKAKRDKIISKEDFAVIKEESNKVFSDALDSLKPYYKYDADSWNYDNDVSSAIAEGASGIREAFGTNKAAKKIIDDLTYYLSNLPTEYFEAKAQRAVQFNEFDTAIVPKDANPEAVKVLRDAGVKIKRYDQKIEGDKNRIIAQQTKLMFSKPESERANPNAGNKVKGSTNTTRQQVITKLANRFGKETIGKLIADGKLDVKVLSDFMLDGELVIPSDVDGLYFRGKVTLIADNLSDDMIIPTFLHELGGHGGMQTLMDKKAYDALMRDFDSLVKAGDPLAMQAKAMADKVARNEQDALDEYLPYLITLTSRQQAKQGKVAGMINRMVMAIRSWLRNTLGVPIAINAQDILSLAERMVNEVEKQNSTSETTNAVPQFSDPNIPDKQMQDVRDQYENTDQWLKAPNGKPSNLTEQQWLNVRTSNFKNWFGDWEGDPANSSQSVDENGEPLVLYRGDKDIWNEYDTSRQGENTNDGGVYGVGAYLSPSKKEARDYGSNVREFFANTRRTADFKDFQKNVQSSDIAGKLLMSELHPTMRFPKNYSYKDYRTDFKALSDKARKNSKVGISEANVIAANQLARKYKSKGANNPILQSIYNPMQFGSQYLTDVMRGLGYDSSRGKSTGAYGADEYVVFDSNQIKSTDNTTFDGSNPDIRFSRAAGMNDQFDPRNIAKETAARFHDWVSSAPPGKLSWWHKTVGTMYNLAQRNPYFKPIFENTEKFINDVSFYAAKASELAPRLLPQLDSLRDITKSAIGAKDNEALSKPIFEGTLLWGRDLDGKAVLIEDWRKKVMAASKQDRLQMLKDANRITPAQLQELAKMNNIQANRFINGIIDEEVSAGLVWTDSELRSKFDLSDEQIELYREFRSATDKSLDSLTRSDMLRRLGKDANDIETAVMEAGTLREAVFNIEQHINSLIQANPRKEKALKQTLKDIKESQFRTNKLIDDGYAPLSRFGQYTVDVVDADGNREYFGMFESAYEARKMEAEMKALYDDPATHTVSRGTLSNEEFKLFAGVTPETAELFGEMLGLDATGDKAADEAFQEYIKRTKNNRSAMKRLMHRKGIKGYSEDVGRVLASFIYSNARHTSAALNMSNIDRAITDIPKGEGQLKDAAVKLAEYIKNPQEEAQLMRGWMFAQYLGGSIASAVVNITQPIAVSFPYLSQFGGAVKAASQLGKASSDWTKAFKDKDRSHFEPDLLAAIEKAEADGTLSPQEVHNLLKQASGKNPLSAGDGTKVGDARALAGNTLSRVSLAWGALFSGAEQINRRVTFVAAYRMAVEQGMANPAEFATKSIKETQFVYNKASRMNWGRGAVGGTLMTFKTYTVSYIELMHRLWNQGEKGSVERAQGRKATMIMLGVMFLLSGSGGLPFMEDAEDLIDGIGQIMGYNLSSKKARQDFLDAWFGEMLGDFLESGASTLPGSPTDVSGRLGLGNLIPGTGIFKERTNNTRDVLEIAGPAGDFAGRIATGTRDIAKGVANLDATSLKKGALEFSPTAVRNAVKGIDMGTSGIYKDTKGYKVTDVSPVDAAFKFAGFQPLKVSKIQEANYLGQTATSFYSLRASNIRALWAAGVVEGNTNKVADARAAVKDWNAKNPDQKIVIKPTDIARRVREMKMEKSERVTKLAPKSMRAQMASDFSQVRDGF